MGEGIVCYKQVLHRTLFISGGVVLECVSMSLERFSISTENRCSDKLPSLKDRLDSCHMCWSVSSKPVALSLVAHEAPPVT